MKKVLMSVLFVFCSYLTFAIRCPMDDFSIMNISACIDYDAVTGKTTVKVAHYSDPGYTSATPACTYLNWYASPLITWLYVKNPTGPGFFGPFKITTDVPHDPYAGVAYSYYDVVIPGFSSQQCYDVYVITNASWSYYDPYNAWGFTPPPGLDPTFYPNFWMTPLGVPAEIYSTHFPINACICEGSDPTPSCKSDFILDYKAGTDPITYIANNIATVNMYEYHPLSTYTVDWGDTYVSGLGSHRYSGSGSYTICVTETMPDGSCCRKCMDFCIASSYSSTCTSSMMKKTSNASVNEQMLKFNLSPNPTRSASDINFTLDDTKSVSVIVNDVTGKIVYEMQPKKFTAGSQKISINTENFTPGIYQVLILAGEKSQVLKLSVVK